MGAGTIQQEMKTPNEQAQDLMKEFSAYLEGWRVFAASQNVCLNIIKELVKKSDNERCQYWFDVFDELQQMRSHEENN